ncbi:MAG TPA: M56 family metallopeptidase [Candidatus Coprocola pullicola]|nr:M56 family metallopeptidase [Candidatus Coprocola pullicola]
MGIVEMNISASLIIAFTMLLRDTALKKLPNIMFCTLWILAIIRLLIPWSITCEVSIFNLYYFFKDDMFYRSDIFSTMQPISVETMIIQEETGIVISGTELIHIIWIIGIIVSALWCIYSYLGNFITIRNSITLEEDSFPVQWMKAQKNFKKVPIKLSWGLDMPVSVGLFFPIILLPYDYDIENEDTIKHWLCHEYMHIKYHHVLWQIIVQVVICINWFNPLIYMMRKYIARDIEVFCDNRAIEFFQPENKKKYALSIIAAADKVQQADKSGKKKKRGLFLYNGFSQNALKERVELLSKWKKVSALTMVTSVLIVTSVTSVFATTSNAVVDERQNDMISQENMSVGLIEENVDFKNEIISGTDTVVLTENDVQIQTPDERAARYLVVRNYKYVQYGYLPKKLDASLEQDGYIYKGTLDLDDYVYESATDKYTGYYSGKLYR